MMQRYENLSKEIEFQTLEIELCEKKIREFNAAAKQRREDLERAQELINDRSEDLAQKKSELDEIISETKQEEEKLREKAGTTLPASGLRLVKVYY
jgi:chromosome segregation ATPase